MFNIVPVEYLFTIGPIAVLSLALSAVAVSYVFLLIRLGKSEKDKAFLQNKIRDHATEILADAHQKRQKIIQEAVDKASGIIKDSEILSIDDKAQFASEIQAMRKKQEEILTTRSEEISKLYTQFETNVLRDTEDQFKIIAKDMENHALAGMGEFREALEGERIFMHKQLSERIEDEYKKVQKNIEEYKLEQMKKVDKQVFDILHALIRDVLGRSLSLKDHEELVQKALLQMKSEINSSD